MNNFGLSNDDVYRCHLCLSVPTAEDFGSLNLAQAAQLIAYEWRRHSAASTCGHARRWRRGRRRRGASGADALAGVLQAIGFLDPQVPKRLMPRLNQLLNRAQVRREELHILRGIARAARRHVR